MHTTAHSFLDIDWKVFWLSASADATLRSESKPTQKLTPTIVEFSANYGNNSAVAAAAPK